MRYSLKRAGSVRRATGVKRSRPCTTARAARSMKCLLAVALAMFAARAGADLWGYLDEQGSAHFATEKLDERYQLFFKGETNIDAAARAAKAAPPNEDF